MKKMILILAALMLLWGCTHDIPDMPVTPSDTGTSDPAPSPPEDTAPDDPPPADDDPHKPVQISPLPSAGGIDWNNVISGGGNAVKPDTYSVPVYLTYMHLPSEQRDLSPDDEHMMSVYAPVFSCFKDKQAQQKLNDFIDSLVQGYLEKTEGLYESYKSSQAADPGLHTRPFGWCGVGTEMVGGYLSLSFEYMYSCETYTLDEQGNERYQGSVDSFYSTDLYCLDPATMDVLTIEDIFYNDCDLGRLLGKCIAQSLDSESIELKRPFRGLPSGWTGFCISGSELRIKFPSSNPYEQYGVTAAIPLWKLRHSLCLRDSNTELLDFGYMPEDERPTPSVCVFENSDFSAEVYEEGSERLLRIVQHSEGDYAIEKINADMKDMYYALASLRPDDGSFDFPPQLNKECYILANLVTVSYSLSVKVNDQWHLLQHCAVYDLKTGDRLKADDVVVIDENFKKDNAYLTTSIPDDLGSSSNLFINAYGSAIICWDNGKASAWAGPRHLKTDIWRNVE